MPSRSSAAKITLLMWWLSNTTIGRRTIERRIGQQRGRSSACRMQEIRSGARSTERSTFAGAEMRCRSEC